MVQYRADLRSVCPEAWRRKLGWLCRLPAKPGGGGPEPDHPGAALLHTKTWFELAPKAANIIIKGEKMGPEPVIKGLWVVTALVTVVILFVALFW
jgi:hypothetical protein